MNNQANAAAMEGTLTGESPVTTITFVRTGAPHLDLMSMLSAFLERQDYDWDAMKMALEYFIKQHDHTHQRYGNPWPTQPPDRVMMQGAQGIVATPLSPSICGSAPIAMTAEQANAYGLAQIRNMIPNFDPSQLANLAKMTEDLQESPAQQRARKESIVQKIKNALSDAKAKGTI